MIQHEKHSVLERIAMGDHHAFNSVFMQYYPKINYFISHLIKSEAIAEELTQDIFLKIWENRHTLPGVRSLNAYLYKMAKNVVLNHLEHKFVESAYIEKYEQPSMVDPSDELDAKELEFIIELAISRMPDQRRRIYTMSKVDYKDNEEIAEELGITKKTVENQLSLALKDIRNALSLVILFFI